MMTATRTMNPTTPPTMPGISVVPGIASGKTNINFFVNWDQVKGTSCHSWDISKSNKTVADSSNCLPFDPGSSGEGLPRSRSLLTSSEGAVCVTRVGVVASVGGMDGSKKHWNVEHRVLSPAAVSSRIRCLALHQFACAQDLKQPCKSEKESSWSRFGVVCLHPLPTK